MNLLAMYIKRVMSSYRDFTIALTRYIHGNLQHHTPVSVNMYVKVKFTSFINVACSLYEISNALTCLVSKEKVAEYI